VALGAVRVEGEESVQLAQQVHGDREVENREVENRHIRAAARVLLRVCRREDPVEQDQEVVEEDPSAPPPWHLPRKSVFFCERAGTERW